MKTSLNEYGKIMVDDGIHGVHELQESIEPNSQYKVVWNGSKYITESEDNPNEEGYFDDDGDAEELLQEAGDQDSLVTEYEQIQFLIIDEYEAIEGYNKAIEFFEENGNDKHIIETLVHIRDEEQEHISELEELLEYLTN